MAVWTGTSGADSKTMPSTDDYMYGLGGNDTLNGGYGTDVIYGGDGIDTIRGDTGDDILWGDAGNENFYYSNGDGKDSYYGGSGIDTVYASGTKFTAGFFDSVENFKGTAGTTTIYAVGTGISDLSGFSTATFSGSYLAFNGDSSNNLMYGFDIASVSDTIFAGDGDDECPTRNSFNDSRTLRGAWL